MLEYLSAALASFLSVEVLIALAIGVVCGMAIGIIPGLGPSVGIALLIPIAFSMSPTAALVMMTAMYTTGVYGGSITAVLCHTPGTAASAATTMDGYALIGLLIGHVGMDSITGVSRFIALVILAFALAPVIVKLVNKKA